VDLVWVVKQGVYSQNKFTQNNLHWRKTEESNYDLYFRIWGVSHDSAWNYSVEVAQLIFGYIYVYLDEFV